MLPDPFFWYGLAFKAVMTAAVVVAASVAAQRSGPLMAALITALPTAASATYIILALEHPPAFVAASALGSMAANVSGPKKRWLVLSLVFNLGMLGFFKYYDFFAGSLNGIAGALGGADLLPVFRIVLPIGISFYIFESVTYTIDIYRGLARPANSFLHYAVFISIFVSSLNRG